MILQKPLHIIFNKMGGFLRDYGGTKYLVLFSFEKDDANFDRTRNLIGLKSGVNIFFLIIMIIMQESKLTQVMIFAFKKTTGFA